MGQAKNKRNLLQTDFSTIEKAATPTSHALRRLTLAASDNLGGDCFTIAKLGQILLADQGIRAELVVGYAAWRIGPGDADVIAHTPSAQGHVPEGLLGLAYHAWLALPAHGAILDFTTFQLGLKAQNLDAMDGGRTQCDWQPDYLLAPASAGKTFREVAQAARPVAFHYEAQPELHTLLESTYTMDADNVRMARLVMSNPQAHVVGVNSPRRP